LQRIGKHKAVTLTYRVQVIEVCDAKPDEIASGRFSLA
jgi:hypothetical protein